MNRFYRVWEDDVGTERAGLLTWLSAAVLRQHFLDEKACTRLVPTSLQCSPDKTLFN